MLLFRNSKWLAVSGLILAAAGVVLYTQLGRIADLRMGIAVLNAAAVGSISAVLLGSLSAMIGSVIWARRAAINHVLWVTVPICVVLALAGWLVNVNIHGPSAILLFVMPFAVVTALLLLLIIGVSYRKQVSKTGDLIQRP